MSLSKLTSERNQKALLELASKPGNDICADCKVRNPRWASHNLGIFICMNCASIHRKIGTHITKVKSLTMDVWSNDQLDVMRNMGNIKSNNIYNPNELRHPPPPNIEDGTRDSEMEKYIRAKYEYRKYIDKNALVASKLGPSRSSTSISAAKPASRSVSSPLASGSNRSSTLPSSSSSSSTLPKSNLSGAPLRATSPLPQSRSIPSTSSNLAPQARSVSQPVVAPNTPASPPSQPQQPVPAGGVWNDLIQLQGPTAPSASLPLQYQQPPTMTASPLPSSFTPSFAQSNFNPGASIGVQPTGMGFNPFQQLQQQQQPFSPSFQFSQTPTHTPQIQSSFGQQLFMNQTGLPSPQPSAGAQQYFQPQPQSASLVPQQAQNGMSGFLTPSPSQGMGMQSAPPTQSQFMMGTPSPSIPFQQQPSHSPQLQMQMGLGGGMGMQQQPQATGMFGVGGGLTPSPQPMGMMGGQQQQFGQQQQQPQGQFGASLFGVGGMQQQQQQQPQQAMNPGDQFLSGLAAMGAGGGGGFGSNPFGQPHQFR